MRDEVAWRACAAHGTTCPILATAVDKMHCPSTCASPTKTEKDFYFFKNVQSLFHYHQL